MVRKAIHDLTHEYLCNLSFSQYSSCTCSLSIPQIAHTYTYLRIFEHALSPTSLMVFISLP